MAIANLTVQQPTIPKPDFSWLDGIAQSIGGAIDDVRADRSFSGLADRLQGGAAIPQQQPTGGFLSRLAPQPQQQPKLAAQSAGGRIDPSIRDGIVTTANALGISPVDLATAISYETGGTFDPTKSGPTTQWGQHRGLIQFGEPQAQKYGVNWDDPIGSQLGENGAVANYLRDTGVKPGMGLMDIYSAINAGGVGRYDRSDANNGGAPGTVADKVNNQMAGHLARARALFGGDNAALEANLGTPYQPSLTPPDPNAEARRQEAMKQIVGGQQNAADAVTAMGEGGSLASAFSGERQAPRAPMQVADSAGGGGLIAQGVTPVQPGTVDPSIIQYMLRDRNLRETGLKLWAANAGGQKASEPWQFVNLPDGTLARANQQTGAVERLGTFSKPKEEKALINLGDGKLFDPNTRETIDAGGGRKKAPSIVELFDEQTGQPYKARWNDETGSFERVGGVKARSGMSLTTNPDGTVTLTEGTVGNMPKLTESEGRNSGFYGRGVESQQILNDLESQGTSLWNKTVGNIPVAGNFLRSADAQKYDQAKRNFINAVLRRESGAVISPEEFANAEEQYFPQPGDGNEVIAQKRRNRDTTIQGLKVSSGQGAPFALPTDQAPQPPSAPTPPAPPQAAVPRVTSPTEYERLPSGARYTDPNGNIRTKR